MKPAIPVSAALMLFSSCAFAWGDGCDYRAERNLDIDAQSLASIELLARAGDLDIIGDPNLATIQIRGKACSSDESLLPEVKLIQRREGDRQIVEVVVPEVSGWWSEQVSLELVARVPARLGVKLKDSSGDARVSGVASLDAMDSSGDFSARDIAGDVRLQDSSGDLNLSSIRGNVVISNDSSGDISISDVQRNATIDVDSSGNVTLRAIRGDATVTHDSSGDITFEQIGGSALVGNDSSGDISARDVAMAFSVRNDTSGDVSHHGVVGKVTVPVD